MVCFDCNVRYNIVIVYWLVLLLIEGDNMAKSIKAGHGLSGNGIGAPPKMGVMGPTTAVGGTVMPPIVHSGRGMNKASGVGSGKSKMARKMC